MRITSGLAGLFSRISPDVVRDLGILIIRLMLSTVLIFHGGQKLFGWWHGPGLAGFASFLDSIHVPYPAYGAVLAGGAEFFGGLAIATGLWFRWAILPVVATMGTAIAFVHPHHFAAQEGGMEYPLTLAVVGLGLLLTGPGQLAIRRLSWFGWPSKNPSVIHITSEPRLDRSFG